MTLSYSLQNIHASVAKHSKLPQTATQTKYNTICSIPRVNVTIKADTDTSISDKNMRSHVNHKSLANRLTWFGMVLIRASIEALLMGSFGRQILPTWSVAN